MGVVALHIDDFDIGRAVWQTWPFFYFWPKNQVFFGVIEKNPQFWSYVDDFFSDDFLHAEAGYNGHLDH